MTTRERCNLQEGDRQEPTNGVVCGWVKPLREKDCKLLKNCGGFVEPRKEEVRGCGA